MAETSLRVQIDGSGAAPAAKALDSDLSRLKASGDGVTSSMDKLSRELGDLRTTLTAAEQRSLALLKSQDSLTAATRAQEAAITSLTADLRAQTQAQLSLATAINTANERSRQQVGVQRELESSTEAATSSAKAFGQSQGQASASSLLLGRSLGSLTGLLGGLSLGAIITSSIQLAVEFERLDLRFQTVFGSARLAGREMAFVRGEADRLGAEVSVLAAQYSSLSAASLGTTLEGQKTRDIFSAITEASGKLGLSTEQTGGALTAIQQIISKGTVSAEELRGQLGERLPGAFQIAARAMGVTTAQLGKMLEQGSLASDVFLPKFADELRRTFGTDATTRIDSVSASFSRLRSEVQLAAGEAAKFPTSVLADLSDYVATLLRYEREGGGLATLQSAFAPLVDTAIGASNFITRSNVRGIGDLAQSTNEQRAVLAANPFTPQIDPFAPAVRDFSVVPKPAGGTREGPGILGIGVPLPDQKELLKLAEREEQFRARALGLTNEQRVQQSILNGELKNRNALEQQAELRIARLQDQITGNTAAKREGVKVESEAERLAKQLAKADAERAEKADELILRVQTQRQELKQQLTVGVQLTQAGEQLARLRAGELDATFIGREAAKEQLAIELQGLDALQQKVAAQNRLNEAGKRAAADLQEGPLAAGAAQRLARSTRNGRRGGIIQATFDDISAQQGAAADSESLRYEKQVNALAGADEGALRKDGLLKEDETVNDLIERAREEHQARLTTIEQDGLQARQDLTRQYVGASINAFGSIADAAAAFGKKGFAAYKAAAIAQTIISTYQSAQDSYKSLSGIPVVGPALGAAAAAASIVAGLGRVAQIRSQQYGGGREFGGPVDASRFYEIGEKGKPEIINTGGKYYLFGAKGNVIPASQGGRGGGSAPVINFRLSNNGQPANVSDFRTRQNSDGSIDIDAVMVEIGSRFADNGSRLRSQLSRATGGKNVGDL